MKKKLVSIAIFVMIAVAAAWNINENKNEITISDLALENVEALAQGESGGSRYQTMGYCTPNRMDYMCTSRVTAEACRRSC